MLKNVFLNGLLIAGSLLCGKLQGSQEVLKMREDWLSAIAEPQ